MADYDFIEKHCEVPTPNKIRNSQDTVPYYWEERSKQSAARESGI